MVAIDPMTGAVRVLVGGRDYYESNFNRATQVHWVSLQAPIPSVLLLYGCLL